MPYAQSEFIPITPVTNTPNVLVVNPSLPIALGGRPRSATSRRGRAQVNYGTFGIGSSAHLAALLFESRIGAKMHGRALSRRRAGRGRRDDRRGADGVRHAAVGGGRRERRQAATDRGDIAPARRASIRTFRPFVSRASITRTAPGSASWRRRARRSRSCGSCTRRSRAPWCSPTFRRRSPMPVPRFSSPRPASSPASSPQETKLWAGILAGHVGREAMSGTTRARKGIA